MAVKKYLDEHGLATLVEQIKKNTAKVYKVKGSAIYADADYLASADKHSEIDSVGLWQLQPDPSSPGSNKWTEITTFEVGWVYNIINTFTTDTDFVEGAGSTVEAGSNIVVAEAEGDPVVYKWDQLGNVLDLTDYQTKKLVAPLTVFNTTDGSATAGTVFAALPMSEPKASATIETYDVYIMTDDAELGDVYRAYVSENASDATQNDITWVKLGNQTTVEGALEFLGNVAPNTPIKDAEIIALFNN